MTWGCSISTLKSRILSCYCELHRSSGLKQLHPAGVICLFDWPEPGWPASLIDPSVKDMRPYYTCNVHFQHPGKDQGQKIKKYMYMCYKVHLTPVFFFSFPKIIRCLVACRMKSRTRPVEVTIKKKDSGGTMYTFVFNKVDFFPAEKWTFLRFPGDMRLKIFLWIFLDYIVFTKFKPKKF